MIQKVSSSILFVGEEKHQEGVSLGDAANREV
jgi:hypothetical protein